MFLKATSFLTCRKTQNLDPEPHQGCALQGGASVWGSVSKTVGQGHTGTDKNPRTFAFLCSQNSNKGNYTVCERKVYSVIGQFKF